MARNHDQSPYETMSKRRRGFLTSKRMSNADPGSYMATRSWSKSSVATTPCPCGSGHRFQGVLSDIAPVSPIAVIAIDGVW